LPHLTLASRSPAVRDVKSSHDVSSEFPKTAPSPSWEPRSPLPRARDRAHFGDRSPTESRVPPSWFSTTLTACSSSTLSGCCTGVPVLGFVTFRAVRRCRPRHGILPFEALLPVHSGLTRGWRTILAPGRRHRRSPPVHRRPCLLVLGCPGPRGVAPCAEPCPAGCCHHRGIVAPLGLSGFLLHAPGGCIDPRARAWGSASPARAGSAHQVRRNVKDRREAQLVSRGWEESSRSPPHRLRRR